MTHRLVNLDEAAQRLGISAQSLRQYVSKGLLAPDVPGEPGYFDAARVKQFKKRLLKRRRRRRRNWLLAGAISAALLTILWAGRQNAES
jgi:hypothetical protein